VRLTLLTVSAAVILASPVARADGTDITKADSVSDTTDLTGGPQNVEDLLRIIATDTTKKWRGSGGHAKAAIELYRFRSAMVPQWDKKPGPATLVLTVWSWMNRDSTNFEARVAKYEGLEVLDTTSHSFELKPDDSQTVEFAVNVPPNDTSRIRIEVAYDQRSFFKEAGFIADSKSAQHFHEWVCAPPPPRPKPPPKDTTLYRVRIDLRDGPWYGLVMAGAKMNGHPLIPTADSGVYIARFRRQAIKTFNNIGVTCEPLDSLPPWPPASSGN